MSIINEIFTCLGICIHGNIRLEDEDSVYDGKMKVCYNGVWEAVCDDGVDDSVAEVVCRQLGLSLHSKYERYIRAAAVYLFQGLCICIVKK